METNIILRVNGEVKDAEYTIQMEDIFNYIIGPYERASPLASSTYSFSGRCRELKLIDNDLKRYKICVICGLGGIGKTELAKKYVRDYGHKYNSICIWINAITKTCLKQSFKGIASGLGVATVAGETDKLDKRSVQEIYRRMNKQKCLFIFDDAQSRSMLSYYLPPTMGKRRRVHVLITSQNTGWGRITPLQLNKLPLSASCQVIRKSLWRCLDVEEVEKDVTRLARLLHGLPLALQQATAYIQEKLRTGSIFTIKNYIDEYSRKGSLLDHRFEGHSTFPKYSEYSYNKTISLTVAFCLEKIIHSNNELAIYIILTIAYFAPKQIPKKMFLPFLDDKNDMGKIDTALKVITKYSLVTLYNDIFLNIQALVQNAIRDFLKRVKKEEVMLKAALTVINEDYKDSQHCAYILKYAQKRNLIQRFYFQDCKEKKAFLFALVRNNLVKPFQDILKNVKELKVIQGDVMQAAVMSGNIALVQLLLEKRLCTLNTPDYGPVLCTATKYRDIKMVSYLIENGANLDDKNVFGDTPLHMAVRASATNMVKWLLNHGSNINMVNNYGECALKIAVCKENIDLVRYLVEVGANVNDIGSYQHQPLYWAACVGNTALVRLFLAAGAKLYVRNEHLPATITAGSMQVLIDEKQLGFLSIVKTCARGSDGSLVPFQMRDVSSMKHYKEVIKILLMNAININN